jgi:hypothetical protein
MLFARVDQRIESELAKHGTIVGRMFSFRS